MPSPILAVPTLAVLALAVLTLALSAPAALAMPGATVGIAVGSPDPFGRTMRPMETTPPPPEAREGRMPVKRKKARPSPHRARR